jgi:hypothetical protein
MTQHLLVPYPWAPGDPTLVRLAPSDGEIGRLTIEQARPAQRAQASRGPGCAGGRAGGGAGG